MTTIKDRASVVAADLGAADKIPVHRDAQAGGNSITLSEFGAFIVQFETFAGSLSGTGTTQGGATLLAANKNIATTVTGANSAFRMPPGSSTLGRCALFNDDAADSLLLFPATGEDIGAGVNASLTIAIGDWAIFEKKSAGVWFLVGGTVSF